MRVFATVSGKGNFLELVAVEVATNRADNFAVACAEVFVSQAVVKHSVRREFVSALRETFHAVSEIFHAADFSGVARENSIIAAFEQSKPEKIRVIDFLAAVVAVADNLAEKIIAADNFFRAGDKRCQLKTANSFGRDSD